MFGLLHMYQSRETKSTKPQELKLLISRFVSSDLPEKCKIDTALQSGHWNFCWLHESFQKYPAALFSHLKYSHFVQRTGLLTISEERGGWSGSVIWRDPLQWRCIALGHRKQSFSSFHQTSENLSLCRGTRVKATGEFCSLPSCHVFCWCGKAVYPKCPAPVNCFSGSKYTSF